MASNTLSPNAAARSLSVALKRTITPKGVRTMARATIARFDKTKHPEYQAHLYSAAEVASLRKSFAARTPRAVAQPVRKPRKTVAKVASVAKVAKVTDAS